MVQLVAMQVFAGGLELDILKSITNLKIIIAHISRYREIPLQFKLVGKGFSVIARSIVNVLDLFWMVVKPFFSVIFLFHGQLQNPSISEPHCLHFFLPFFYSFSCHYYHSLLAWPRWFHYGPWPPLSFLSLQAHSVDHIHKSFFKLQFSETLDAPS